MQARMRRMKARTLSSVANLLFTNIPPLKRGFQPLAPPAPAACNLMTHVGEVVMIQTIGIGWLGLRAAY
jgi:hypothetical protein